MPVTVHLWKLDQLETMPATRTRNGAGKRAAAKTPLRGGVNKTPATKQKGGGKKKKNTGIAGALAGSGGSDSEPEVAAGALGGAGPASVAS